MVDNDMRFILAFLLALSPFFLSQSHADASDISAATRSVVRVVVYSSAEGQRTIVSIGSGVVVAPDKIVTNAHVVEQARLDERGWLPSERQQRKDAHFAGHPAQLPCRLSMECLTQLAGTICSPFHAPLFKYRRPKRARSRAVVLNPLATFSLPPG